MARLEILMLEEPPTFGVNLVADPPEVVVAIAPPVGGITNFVNASGFATFVQEDHIDLLSVCLRLPWCFGISTGRTRMGFSWEWAGGEIAVTELGASGAIHVPLNRQEIELDRQFARYAAGVSPLQDCSLILKSLYVNISMVGVPASFHESTQEVQVALKILHTENMIA